MTTFLVENKEYSLSDIYQYLNDRPKLILSEEIQSQINASRKVLDDAVSEDKVIYDYAIDHGFNSFRGSESDVLDRFYQAVRNEKPDWIVRVTSDCPLIDPILVDKLIKFAHNNNRDY